MVTSFGKASRPSITNSPIWAIQPMPSTKLRVAARWGSRALPSISAHAYTAAKPLACTTAVALYANTAQTSVASG